MPAQPVDATPSSALIRQCFHRENHLFGCTRSKPSQGSVPTGVALASDFSFCFQCEVGSNLVLHRPIETTNARVVETRLILVESESVPTPQLGANVLIP